MITKIKRLKAIGKFYDFSRQENTLDWQKNTFVFAPNAYGKSTLVNVLRSLCDNDPKLIRARKTLGVTAAAEAVIAVGGTNHVFNGMRWDRPFSSIQIFDAPFIHANILTHEIGHEHKKNIHKIIIGEKGIKLSLELATLKAMEKANTQELQTVAKQFIQGGFGFSLNAFLAIPPEEETAVPLRIEKLERDIKSKESETVIQGISFPSKVSAPSFDLSSAKELAIKKLVPVSEAIEKLVCAHIDRNIKDKSLAKQFIRQGLDLIQADCPFCGQDLKNAPDLLRAYREFFNEAFRDYQLNVTQQVASLVRWNLDNDLTEILSIHNANLAILRQWEPYLGPINLPNATAIVENRRAELVDLKGRTQSELEKKQRDPIIDADLSIFKAAEAKFTELNTVLTEYNSAVTTFTEKAKSYVSNLPKSDVASMQAALKKDQQIKTRFSAPWKKWATDYMAAKTAAESLGTKKNDKQKELEEYSKTIFETYQKRINELLVTLGTDFTIAELTGKTDERANESYSDFCFVILQQTVPLAARQDEPCFRNTLSEGDKSTLAFAFFVAALEKMTELDKQIVVFDDPLSSLDETRREATARLLLALSPKVMQLNVFTHKKDFLYMLCDKMPENKTLRVRFDKKNGSCIEPFDVDHDRKGDYAHMVEAMERYVDEDFGPTPETMQGSIRKVFETVLKTKYYRVLATEIKEKKGLARLLETLFKAKLLDETLKPRLFDLCNVTNGPHHGEIVDAPSKKLSRDEIIPLITETLGLLEKL